MTRAEIIAGLRDEVLSFLDNTMSVPELALLGTLAITFLVALVGFAVSFCWYLFKPLRPPPPERDTDGGE